MIAILCGIKLSVVGRAWIPALFPNTGISVLEKNQYRYTGINTGIQRLPILTVVDGTKCKLMTV